MPSGEILNDKMRFPTLTRFIPYQPVDIAGCFMALLKKFGWSHTALIHENTLAYYSSVGSSLYDLLISETDSATAYFSFDSTNDDSVYRDVFIQYLAAAKGICRGKLMRFLIIVNLYFDLCDLCDLLRKNWIKPVFLYLFRITVILLVAPMPAVRNFMVRRSFKNRTLR